VWDAPGPAARTFAREQLTIATAIQRAIADDNVGVANADPLASLTFSHRRKVRRARRNARGERRTTSLGVRRGIHTISLGMLATRRHPRRLLSHYD
jgi:hypothetical protein